MWFYQCVFHDDHDMYILMTYDILQATWYSREFLYIRRFKVQYSMHCKVFKLQNQNTYQNSKLSFTLTFLQNFCFVIRVVQICIWQNIVIMVNKMIYLKKMKMNNFVGIHCTIHYDCSFEYCSTKYWKCVYCHSGGQRKKCDGVHGPVSEPPRVSPQGRPGSGGHLLLLHGHQTQDHILRGTAARPVYQDICITVVFHKFLFTFKDIFQK